MTASWIQPSTSAVGQIGETVFGAAYSW